MQLPPYHSRGILQYKILVKIKCSNMPFLTKGMLKLVLGFFLNYILIRNYQLAAYVHMCICTCLFLLRDFYYGVEYS